MDELVLMGVIEDDDGEWMLCSLVYCLLRMKSIPLNSGIPFALFRRMTAKNTIPTLRAAECLTPG